MIRKSNGKLSNCKNKVKNENKNDPELNLANIGGGFSNLDEIKEARPNFLKEQHIRDINGRRPSDEGYDDTSLFIPEECWKIFTPAML